MTIHFAAARVAARSPIAQVLALCHPRPAANDNCDLASPDAMRAALYHFAKYGMGAARDARDRAETAFFAGNRREYDRWLEVCRQLDRRMAAQFERAAKP